MSLFGNRRDGSGAHGHANTTSHYHGPGQQCSHNHGPSSSAAGSHEQQHYHRQHQAAGGALGQQGQTRVAQPGMEMMPSGIGGGGGGGGRGGVGGLGGMGDLGASLQGAPADVLAAAERLSLISPMMGGDLRGVVSTVPGMESTDTGALSEATIASQLLVAVRTRDLHTVRRLCSTPSDRLAGALKRRDGQGHTLMHWAAKSGEVEMLEILAASGCPTTDRSTEAAGMTPLHWAATEGRLRASAWLLGPGGADPEERDNQGCTALVIAAQYGFVELVIFLSHHGCDLASVDSVGDSALHWAAYKGHVQVLSMLIKSGQDPDMEDVYGQTPLHLAALRGNLDVAEYLVVEEKANVNAKDKKNETPLDLALKKKQPSMELFLRTSGAGQSWMSPAVFVKLARTPRVWKAACETGEGVQGARWPLPLNLVLMGLAIWVTMYKFFGDAFISLGHSSLLTACFFSQVLMWVSFLLTWLSNPGFVDPTNPEVSAVFRRRQGVLTGGGRGSSGHDQDVTDLDIEDPSEGLIRLESGVGSVANSACYTCAIVQPLRARHCRSCRRCVRAFDHHCPFVGNCVGAGNYRWFFSYVVFLLLSAILYVVVCLEWWWFLGFSPVIAVSGVYAAFFGLFASFLLIYHSQLTQKNLTTNEHRSKRRIDYLRAPNNGGQFYNPFDRGCPANFLDRMAGKHDEPPPGLLARLRGNDSGCA